MNLREIGRFGKPHGIGGEINATSDVDLVALRCIVVDIDGIDVPFFIESVRNRGTDGAVLVKIDGCDNEIEAKRMFSNKTIYALADEVKDLPGFDSDEEEGLYASDLIGFKVLEADGKFLGTIADIDDNTANVLFIVERPESSKLLYIPVADEFIDSIDTEGKTLTMSLPQGIKDLN